MSYVLVFTHYWFSVSNSNLLADNDAEAERKVPGSTRPVVPSAAAAAAALAAEMARPFRITFETTPAPTPTPNCACPEEEVA